MTTKIGYLLPTREYIMRGQMETKTLLALAQEAESLGFDSVWVGDSLIAKPRHEPLTLLAGVATCTSRIQLGTAVLLPALRNPVILAHQIATLDQLCEGRLILGVGIAADIPSVRAEFAAAGVPFDKRVGRLMEGMRLMKALWRGQAVDWQGRWTVEQATLAPIPYQSGGPPLWYGGGTAPSRERTGKHFDGWFPTGPAVENFPTQWSEVKASAKAAGRDPKLLSNATYLTIALDENIQRGDSAIDSYLQNYYHAPPAALRKFQACFAGSESMVAEWLNAYINAGAEHLMLRFVGDHKDMLNKVSRLRERLGT